MMFLKSVIVALLSSSVFTDAATLRNSPSSSHSSSRHSSSHSSSRHSSSSRTLKKSTSSECTIQVVALLEINPGTIEDEVFECEMDPSDVNGFGGMTRRIDGTDEQKQAFKEMLKKGLLVPGESTLRHGPSVPFDEENLFLPPGLDVASSVGKWKGKEGKGGGNAGDNGLFHRTLQTTNFGNRIGNKYVLAVRVIDVNGLAHPRLPEAMSDDIFGTGTDPVNLKSQIYSCSMQRLNMIPGDPGKPDFPVDQSRYLGIGVMQTQISIDITTATSRYDVRNAVIAKVQSELGFALPGPYDYVMFNLQGCYNDCGWAAYAYINSWNSVFQGNYYYQTGVLVHEFGHNFGLAHSGGLNGATYTDHTCMMGNPLYSDDVGKMCYNPAKNWQIGWYNDRKLLLSPLNEASDWSTDITIVGIANYEDTSTESLPVVVKLETGTTDDFFVGFNRATGINADNDEADDLVTVVKTGNNGDSYSQSYLQGYYNVGGQHVLSNFGLSSSTVYITVIAIDKMSSPWTARVRFSKTTPPTPSPTPFFCLQKVLNVNILTDNYPGETSWTLTNKCTSTLQLSSRVYPATNTQYNERQCIPAAQYDFVINDSYGDGICCSYGSGSYEVTYDSTVVASGGAFGSSETTTFGSCGPAANPPTTSPTASPTKGPTASPTSAPTGSPTTSPTAAPSKSPTASPTKGPTAPTTSPTKGPTATPTTSPTKGPTVSPTSAPTGSPTPSPTVAPTASPTTSPTIGPTVSPTTAPTGSPTTSPTPAPSKSPTTSPTKGPTTSPTPAPTGSPTTSPTLAPSKLPTTSPTKGPTASPIPAPTGSPTTSPTLAPSKSPTTSPTKGPTASPTPAPTVPPTTSPTPAPTKSPTIPPTKGPTASPTPAPTSPPTPLPDCSALSAAECTFPHCTVIKIQGTNYCIDPSLCKAKGVSCNASSECCSGSCKGNGLCG